MSLNPDSVIPVIQRLTGENEEVVVEVASQLDPQTVRGIALNPIRGLGRCACR